MPFPTVRSNVCLNIVSDASGRHGLLALPVRVRPSSSSESKCLLGLSRWWSIPFVQWPRECVCSVKNLCHGLATNDRIVFDLRKLLVNPVQTRLDWIWVSFFVSCALWIIQLIQSLWKAMMVGRANRVLTARQTSILICFQFPHLQACKQCVGQSILERDLRIVCFVSTFSASKVKGKILLNQWRSIKLSTLVGHVFSQYGQCVLRTSQTGRSSCASDGGGGGVPVHSSCTLTCMLMATVLLDSCRQIAWICTWIKYGTWTFNPFAVWLSFVREGILLDCVCVRESSPLDWLGHHFACGLFHVWTRLCHLLRSPSLDPLCSYKYKSLSTFGSARAWATLIPMIKIWGDLIYVSYLSR